MTQCGPKALRDRETCPDGWEGRTSVSRCLRTRLEVLEPAMAGVRRAARADRRTVPASRSGGSGAGWSDGGACHGDDGPRSGTVVAGSAGYAAAPDEADAGSDARPFAMADPDGPAGGRDTRRPAPPGPSPRGRPLPP